MDLVDALRGLAIVQMMVFHFCFLLKEFGIAFEGFATSAFWAGFRILIVSQFLLIAGVSLRVAWSEGMNWGRYSRRLVQLAIYGAILTIATSLLAPERTIFFGILQFILVASVLALLFVRWSWQNLVFGAFFCALGVGVAHPSFDRPWLHWLGMMTHEPTAGDYVPLLPWFGLVVTGLYLGQLLIEDPRLDRARVWRANGAIDRGLALMGRHSLNLYMAHIPAFAGAIYLFASSGA